MLCITRLQTYYLHLHCSLYNTPLSCSIKPNAELIDCRITNSVLSRLSGRPSDQHNPQARRSVGGMPDWPEPQNLRAGRYMLQQRCLRLRFSAQRVESDD